MTTIHEAVKMCMHCGKINKFQVLGSTSTFGPSDLDTRPAPLARQAIEYEIQRCSQCNYASDDIEKIIKFDDSILTSENYIKVLNSDYPELAKSYILASMIKESIRNYNEAAVFMIKACWVLDDNKIDAKKPRIIAAKLFEKSIGIEPSRLIIIDLYRRAEEFEAAKIMINKSKEFIDDKFQKKVLQCEEVLVDIYDSECHNCSEIDTFIGESGLEKKEELETDTMEEVERKLFSDDSEPITLRSDTGKIVTFQQIAVIPLEILEEKNIYVILRPEDEDLPEDEALVFQLIGEENLEELSLIKDDDVIDLVFNEYYKLVEDSHK